jgi:tape measure domain-containing protein
MADKDIKYKILADGSQFDKTLDKAASKTKSLDASMGKLGGVIAGAFSVAAVTGFGKAVVESLKNYEYFTAAIRTMLKGDKEEAAALQGQLVQLAKTTPFELTEVQDASKQLLAYGFQAGDLVDTMKTLGNVSSGIGAPLQDIAYLYGTLKTSGRVTLMDLRQFAGRGIPIYETLAKRLGVTTDKINEMVHVGKLGFKDIEGAFKDMTKEGGQFFNLMDEQSKTVGGQLSNMGDSWEQLKVNIGKSQKGIIANTVAWASNMVGIMNDYFVKSNFRNEATGGLGKLGIENGAANQDIDKRFSMMDAKGNVTLLKTMKERDKWVMAQQGKWFGENNANTQSRFEEFSNDLKSSIDKMKPEDARNKLNEFTEMARDIKSQMHNGEISNTLGVNELSVLNKSVGEVRGLIKLSTDKGANNLNKNAPGGKAKGEPTVTDVSSARPQNLTINIETLKGADTMEFHTQNLTESTDKIKEAVVRVVLESVNDINQITK